MVTGMGEGYLRRRMKVCKQVDTGFVRETRKFSGDNQKIEKILLFNELREFAAITRLFSY